MSAVTQVIAELKAQGATLAPIQVVIVNREAAGLIGGKYAVHVVRGQKTLAVHSGFPTFAKALARREALVRIYVPGGAS